MPSHAPYIAPDEDFAHRDQLPEGATQIPLVDDGQGGQRCMFLTDEALCSIYESRPQDCRQFDCSQNPGFLRHQPDVVALLTLEGVPILRDPFEGTPAEGVAVLVLVGEGSEGNDPKGK